MSVSFKEPQKAFEEAIEKGKLNKDPKSENYAGKWMYMHTEEKGDAFKNIDTREYMWVSPTEKQD